MSHRWRSLTAKTLGLVAVHLVALATAAGAFAVVQLGSGFNSFLLAPARERLMSVGREFAEDVGERSRTERDAVAGTYSRRFGVRAVLITNDGRVMAGVDALVPEAVREQLRRGTQPGRGRGPSGTAGPPLPVPPGGRRLPPVPSVPPFLVTVDGPLRYWIGVRIPIMEAGQFAATPGTLLLASSTLVGNPFYVDPWPWLVLLGAALFISVLCWVPFVRGLTRDVTRLTGAAQQIASGHFAVPLQSARRDELGVLAGEIARMAQQLESLIQGQKQFLADAAHELRSPLARITVAASLAERGGDWRTREHLGDLRDDVALMRRLTDDLLIFAKRELSAAPTRLEPTTVREVVEAAVQQEARAERVEVAVPADLQVLASREHLERAIANLVRNAMQHGEPHGAVRVAAVREVEPDTVTLTVSDEGPGVPEAEIAGLFTPFKRTDASRSRNTGGVGLGLAIVRSAAESCGGSVSCRNLSPRGFEVALRLRTAS